MGKPNCCFIHLFVNASIPKKKRKTKKKGDEYIQNIGIDIEDVVNTLIYILYDYTNLINLGKLGYTFGTF